ncbi:MAG: hypothetical protein E7371_00055 [Clostridiales bacterium]|nr:hypothetical protein [Clostridiales bacterium]
MKFVDMMKNKKRNLSLLMTSLIMVGCTAGAASCNRNKDSSSTNNDSSVSASDDSTSEVTKYYTVTFDVDGGSAIDSVTVEEGETVAKPATNPAKDGYVFVGWYMNKTYTTPFAFGTTAIKADTTVYAKFVQVEADAAVYNVNYVVDGNVYATATTVNGAVYQLPTPTKDGATFAGWWKSDYNDAAKVTAKFEDGTEIAEDVTLYAVWESNAPNVSINGNTISWTAKGANNQYSVKVLAEDGSEVAKTVTSQSSYTFDFASAAEGNYTVEVTLNGNTGKAYCKNKALAKVSGYASEGTILTWTAVPNATSYLVSLECGDAAHTHIEEVVTTNAYDFANCAMKSSGIKFTVKAVADGYMTSDATEFVVLKTLDAVSGLAYDAATASFTWDAVEEAASYSVTINGETTTTNTNSISVKNLTGALTISVVPVTFGYNSPAATELAMTKTSLPVPTGIKLVGSSIVWNAVDGATGYVVKIDNKEYTVTGESFDIFTADNIAEDATSCSVSVKVTGATADADSIYSDAVQIGFGVMSDSLVYSNGKVAWQPVLNAKAYEVQVNNGDIISVAGDVEESAITFTQSGEHVIKVRVIDNADKASEWVETTVTAYKVNFNYGVYADTNAPVYLANGDSVTLDSNLETPGYTFKGWFSAEENGAQLPENFVLAGVTEDITVYAQWDANTYTITCKYVDLATGDEKESSMQVTYGQSYTIASPYSAEKYEEEGKTFFGWFTEKNGQGVKYTDEVGNSLSTWGNAENVTLYASILEAFKYNEITTAGGQAGYSISAGADFNALSEITIPAMYKGKPVAWIESGAFASYTNLKKMNIPDSIELIYLGLEGAYSGTGSAFYNCSNLEEINVYDASASMDGNYQKNYMSIDGALVRVYETGAKELSFVPVTKTGEYTIPAEVTDIAPYLFRMYKNFNKIIVPVTVQKIGDNAFQGAKGMEVIFEDGEGASELIVGENLFALSDIASFNIPARMGQVSSFNLMFRQVEELKSITVSEGNKYYSSKPANSTTTSYNMLFNADGTTLLYCPRGIDDVVEIPNGTKTIKTNAFGVYIDIEGYGYSTTDPNVAIKSVIIPASVTTIEDSAFEDCIGLETLTFKGTVGDGTLNIGARAFYGTRLTSLELPGNTGSVGQYAFGKIELEEVTIKSGDASFALADGAFKNADTGAYTITTVKVAKCTPAFNIGAFGTMLEEVIFYENGESDYMKVIDDVLYDKDVTQILYYPDSKTSTTYNIPDGVLSISSNAFAGKPFTEISIPYSMTSIGEGAFKGCSSLKQVIFREKPAGAPENTGLAIADSAFENCSQLATLVLPSYTKTIGASAFMKSGISGEFVIPEGVTTIGAGALQNCSKMTSIKIPTTLTDLGVSTTDGLTMLNGCTNLESITVADGHATYMTENGALYAHEGGVPNALIYCPRKYKFDESLNGKFTVPYTVSIIYAYAFNGNSDIQELAFAAAPEGTTTSGLTIQTNAFAGAANLKRVTLGYGIATITANMFAGCTSLEYLFIPKSVTEIKANAFKGCSSLTELIFEEGAGAELKIPGQSSSGGYQGTSVGLSGLTGLKVLRLPERVKTINNYAFVGLTSLEELYLPLSVTTINADIFNKTSGCKNLKKLVIADVGEGQDPADYGLTIGTYMFAYLPADCEWNLPSRTKAIGAYAFKGRDITSITIPENVTSIGNYAFQNCTSLTEINFAGNSKLATIGNYAFANTAITSFVVPATVTSIGEYAFAYTTNCNSITFQAGSALKEIKQFAFRQCGITELKIPESTDANGIALGASLFQYCTDITKVELSKSVVSAVGTFMGCGSLKQVIIDPANENLSVEGSTVFNADKTSIQFLSGAAETDAEGVYRIANGVTSITNGAFKNQVDIKKLYIPASVQTIGLNAFEGCINLEEVIFENPETSTCATISDYAFYNCHALRKIELPNSVNKLGSYAFRYCYALSDLKMAGVTTLGYYAFANCTSLETVALNDDMTTIYSYAFYGAGLTSIKVPSKLTIKSLTSTGATGSAGIFYNCTSLASVTIPEGVEKLGYTMFYGCTSLQTIDVPASVKEFGQAAFRNSGLTSFEFKHENPGMATYMFAGCTELRTVKLPSNMSAIKGYTFDGCSSLVSTSDDETAGVIIPDSVTSVANYAFRDCTSMKKIKFSESMTFLGAGTSWSSTANSYVLYGCTSLEEVTLSTGMKQIGKYAFAECSNLTTIHNTDKLTTLGDYVFQNSGIVEISLPKVTTLGTYAFRGAERLESVTFGSLTSLKKNTFEGTKALKSFDFTKFTSSTALGDAAFKGSGLEEVSLTTSAIGKEVFMDCENLTKVECPKVKTIGESAFANCTSLTNFTLPDTLTSIGAQAFMGTALTEVTIPANVTGISKNAFAYCNNIVSFTVNEANTAFVVEDNALKKASGHIVLALPAYQVTDGVLYITDDSFKAASGVSPFAGNTTITEVVVTANWTSVPSYFFADMLALKKITLPETVTDVGSYAFAGATALETVVMPGVTSIQMHAFDGASALTTVDMTNVTSVQSYAFAGCALLDVEATEKITSYGTYAFAESGVKSVTLPATMKNIPEGVFYGAKRLTSVTLPEGLETIEIYAFAESGVESITIPASVTEFGTTINVSEPGSSSVSNQKRSYAFANCTSLKTVVFLGENPKLTGHTFEGCTALENVTLPSKMTFVEDYMFYGCTSLKNITLPETVTELGGYAFAYAGLTSITLPASLTVVGTPNNLADTYVADANNLYQTGATQKSPIMQNPNGHTFTGCANLETVTFLGNVTYIGWYSFEGCTKLANITIPNTVEIIGDYAFANCESLGDVVIPESVLFIGNYAFANSKINSITIADATVVYSGAFEGWTAEQTINTPKTAYQAASVWNLDWYKNSNATIVYGYIAE